MGESLTTLFGEDYAESAATMLQSDDNTVMQRVKERVAAHAKVFAARPEKERLQALATAEADGERLARERHHRVDCPACKAVALIKGVTVGPERVYTDGENGEIIVHQQVRPVSFDCRSCGLKLDGYSELHQANLGGFYTRTSTFSAEEYFGLIRPDSPEFDELAIEYMRTHADEYDNE